MNFYMASMGFPKMHLHVCRIWYSSLVPCCHNISIVTRWGDESIHFDPILKCSLCLSMSTHLRPKGILRKPNDFLLVSEGSVRLYWGRFTPFCLKESAVQMSLQNDDNANFLRVCVTWMEHWILLHERGGEKALSRPCRNLPAQATINSLRFVRGALIVLRHHHHLSIIPLRTTSR